jgi:hypothetical protein
MRFFPKLWNLDANIKSKILLINLQKNKSIQTNLSKFKYIIFIISLSFWQIVI